MTVSIRSLVLTAVVAAALVVAYVLGAAQPGGANRAAAGPAPGTDAESPSIVMTGTGTATGVPDQLRFSVGVQTSADDVSTALNSANATTRDVLAALREQGVTARDMQTTGLNIRATYDYSDDGPAVITGYEVSQNPSVLVRSLPDAGAVIGAAAEAGGNAIRLHGIKLQVGDEDALLRRARERAITAARDKAELYAAASGRSLGEVVSVQEAGGTRGTGQEAYRSMALAADSVSRIPVRAGSADLEATVTVVWTLE